MTTGKSLVVWIAVGVIFIGIGVFLGVSHVRSREDRSKERLANAVSSGIESILPGKEKGSHPRSAVDIAAEGAAETLDRLLPRSNHEEPGEDGADPRRRDIIKDTLSEEGKQVVDDAADTIRSADSPKDFLNFGARVLDSASRTVGRVAPTVTAVSQEDLKRASERIHDNIRANHPVRLVRPNGEDLVSKTWRNLLEDGIRRQKNQLRLYVIDAKPFNAFAHAGGYVYVNQGLIDKVNSVDELAYVMAHEIAHIDLGHVNSVVSIMKASSGSGEAGELFAVAFYRMLSTGYSKEQEFEADREGLRMALLAGYRRDKCLRLFEHLRNPSGDTASPDNQESDIEPIRKIFQHFDSHPDPKDRRSKLAN